MKPNLGPRLRPLMVIQEPSAWIFARLAPGLAPEATTDDAA